MTRKGEPRRMEIYQDHNGEWRWRLRSPNHKILADSGEGYARKSYARKMAMSVLTDHHVIFVEVK